MSIGFDNDYTRGVAYPFLNPDFSYEGELPGGPLAGFNPWLDSCGHITRCNPAVRFHSSPDRGYAVRTKIGFIALNYDFATAIQKRWLSYRSESTCYTWQGYEVTYQIESASTLSVLDPITGEYTDTESGDLTSCAAGYNYELVTLTETLKVERWTRFASFPGDPFEAQLTTTTTLSNEYTTGMFIADALAILANPESEYRLGGEDLSPYLEKFPLLEYMQTVRGVASPFSLLDEPSSDLGRDVLHAAGLYFPVAFRRLTSDELYLSLSGGTYVIELPPLLGDSMFTLEWDEVFYPFDDPDSWSVLASRSFSGSQSTRETGAYQVDPPEENGWVYVRAIRYTALAGAGA